MTCCCHHIVRVIPLIESCLLALLVALYPSYVLCECCKSGFLRYFAGNFFSNLLAVDATVISVSKLYWLLSTSAHNHSQITEHFQCSDVLRSFLIFIMWSGLCLLCCCNFLSLFASLVVKSPLLSNAFPTVRMMVVIVVVIWVLICACSVLARPQSARQACIWDWSLPAIHILPFRGKNLSSITMPSSTAVTHCVLAAPHFNYPQRMVGWVNSPALRVEFWPSHMRGSDHSHSATQTQIKWICGEIRWILFNQCRINSWLHSFTW